MGKKAYTFFIKREEVTAMRNVLKKISATLLLAVAEIALGILLLISPEGFTMAVIVAVGILFVISGLLNIIEYWRLPKEEAMQTWKFSAGAAGITLGVLGVVYRAQLMREFAMLTVIYGLVMIMLAYLKLQISVDGVRARIRHWYLMAFSFLLTTGFSLLLLCGIYRKEKTAWIVTGIALIAIAIFDSVYFLISHKDRSEPEVSVPAVQEN